MFNTVSKKIILINKYLTKDKMLEIEAQANLFLTKINFFELNTLDIEKIKEIFNFTIEYGDLTNDKALGKLEILESKKTITINSSLINNKPRLKFTMAHEIGHIVLEHYKEDKTELFRGTENFYESEQDGIQEESANFFASCILMPQDNFINFWNNQVNNDFNTRVVLSQSHFRVSRQAVLLRFYFLKQLSS